MGTSTGACEEGLASSVHVRGGEDEEQQHRARPGGRRRLRRLLGRLCCRIPAGPAAHFWGKLQMALRTALAAGMAAVITLMYWTWAGEVSFFTIILCIIATRATLVSRLMIALLTCVNQDDRHILSQQYSHLHTHPHTHTCM